jgi:predicted HicB family RNase H-like nuclease
MRIINSYQSMVQRAQGVGARVTSDQTARELEAAIRNMLGVNTPAIRELTNLFEEARYSLHAITEDDAGRAQRCLLDISGQMDLRLDVLKIET